MILLLIVCVLVMMESSMALRTWRANNAAALIDSVQRATAGDVVELEPGDYVLRSAAPGLPALIVDRPVTIKSRDSRQRAVLRGDSAAVLIAITSPSVTLSDVIVGKQMSGGDERTIDIYIAAGTQAVPASQSIAYGGSSAAQQTLQSRGEILSARGLQTRKRAAPIAREEESDTMRALHEIALDNVDFSRSLAGTNVAFARGSYADIAITRCVFGRDGASYINAIVSTADAQFVGLNIHQNAFLDAVHVLIGSPDVPSSAVGLNYWTQGGSNAQVFIGSEKRAHSTYCLDAQCSRLGPVINAEEPNMVFASLREASVAQVRHVRVTDDIEVNEVVVFNVPNGKLEGGEGCDGTPLIKITTGGAIVSAGAGALLDVRNIKISLVGERAVGFVITDGTAQRLAIAKEHQNLLPLVPMGTPIRESSGAVMVFDGVSILGDNSNAQLGLVVSAGGARVELQDVQVAHVTYGAVVHRGSLVVVDSTFVGASRVALYAETITHQAGLRVAGSSFIRCEVAVEVGAGAPTTALQEFSVQCSTFLFNHRRLPLVAADCSRKPAICGSAIRYNTILSDHPVQPKLDEAEQQVLRLGANHVEHGRTVERYVYAGEPRHFSLADDQGRLSWVSGMLIGAAADFMIATYVPMRTECLAASESTDVASAQAAIVSDVLELRADSLLHQCNGAGIRFRIDDERTLPESLAIFSVARLGTAQVSWTRALASVQRADNQVTLETTLATHDSAQRHQHRVVVVAMQLLPEALSAALEANSALVTDTPPAYGRRLCVVCSKNDLPPQILDQYCGGTTDHVRTSFDDAYDELQFGKGDGAPRHESAALFVFGDCPLERRCTVVIDQNEHIEGLSESTRGVLHRSPQCGNAGNTPTVQFTSRASKASLRYMTIQRSKTPQECVVAVLPSNAQPGPTIAYASLDGAVCVVGRSGGKYVNNDIASNLVFTFAATAHSTPSAGGATLVEANLFTGGDLLIDGSGGNDEEVRVTRNRFISASNGIVLKGGRVALHAVNNIGVGKLIAGYAFNTTKVSAIENEFATSNVEISLSDGATFNGGVQGTTLAGAGTTVILTGKARVSNVNFGAAAKVSTVAGYGVVLRSVQFENIGASLNTVHECSHAVLSGDGIDLARSTVTNGATKTPVLLLAEQRIIDTDPAAFWRSEDGVLVRCDNNQPALVSKGFKCGCGAATVASRRQLAKPQQETEAKVQEQAHVQQDSSGSHTFVIVLGIVLGFIVICVIIVCIVALTRGAASVAVIRTSAAMASRAQPQERRPNNVTETINASAGHDALAALRLRTPIARNEE